MITEEEHDEYLALLSKRLADPRVADWFANDNRLMLERSVTIGGNGQKRPDRVVMKPNGEIIIVDYKFGDRSDDNDTKYKRQVAGYKRASATHWDADQTVCQAMYGISTRATS